MLALKLQIIKTSQFLRYKDLSTLLDLRERLKTF